MSRAAHWAVEYNDDNDPHATPCDCPYGEDHDDSGPVTPNDLLQQESDPALSFLPSPGRVIR